MVSARIPAVPIRSAEMMRQPLRSATPGYGYPHVENTPARKPAGVIWSPPTRAKAAERAPVAPVIRTSRRSKRCKPYRRSWIMRSSQPRKRKSPIVLWTASSSEVLTEKNFDGTNL